ncbi:MAG: FkbM family methyltransferase [Candidatus Aminicenantes bacterium]|jgi:FkbM family methyltransferase
MRPMILSDLNDLPKNSKVCIICEGFDASKFKIDLEENRSDIEIVAYSTYSENTQYICKLESSFKVKEKIDIKIIKQIVGEIDLILISTESWLKFQNIFRQVKSKFLLIDKIRYKDHIISKKDIDIYGDFYNEVKQIFEKEEDRKLYDLILTARSGSPDCMLKLYDFLNSRKKNLKRQYLDYINYHNIKVVIEGGVYKGRDTIEFLKNFPKVVKIHGFEPFLNTLLCVSAKNTLMYNENVKINKLGLWSKKDTLFFLEEEEDKSASRIIEDDGYVKKLKHRNITLIKTISIDEFVLKNHIKKVDYIKLDIEGAELEALKGSVNTLKVHRPQLAICIYHSKKDLFEIPLFLNKNLDNYSYRLGHYSKTYHETVLYCLPH